MKSGSPECNENVKMYLLIGCYKGSDNVLSETDNDDIQ